MFFENVPLVRHCATVGGKLELPVLVEISSTIYSAATTKKASLGPKIR